MDHEYTEFRKYHKNVFNIWFHIVCGFFYIAALAVLTGYPVLAILVYSCIVAATVDISIAILIAIGLFLVYPILQIKPQFLFIIFILAYFGPDLSHYLSNEPTQLSLETVTPYSLTIVVFYLLPFSIRTLLIPS